ncbi:MAG: hypothetical protein CTY14_06575 [Methylotenera sp.]|nr:MAG: hypothetical protein CTY14_06575 [Methylotenera sp.]
MRFNTTLFPLIILITIEWVLVVPACYAETRAKITEEAKAAVSKSASSAGHSTNPEINAIFKSLSEIDNKLDDRLSEKSQIDEFNNRLSGLEKNAEQAKEATFANNSTLLNILIAFASLIITAIGVGFGILAFIGYKDIKGMKQELTDKYQTSLDSIFSRETSKIREGFNDELTELKENVDLMSTALRQIINDETPTMPAEQSNRQKSSDNAFE